MNFRPQPLWSWPFAVVLLTWLSGCYSYPPVPEPVAGDSYTAIVPERHRALPPDHAMLTLAMAREIALLNNPDFRSARHAMAAADARFYQALTAYLPAAGVSYDFTETRYQPQSRGGMPPHTRNYSTKTLGMSAEWLVFNGLMRTMEALAARHSARQAAANERDARRLLIESVGIAYNQVLLARESIGIAQADEDFNRKLLAETELKYEAGAVALSEVLNFRIRVNEARTALTRTEYQFDTSRSILAELLSLTEGTIAPDLFPPMPEVAVAPEMAVEVHLDMALANRPDLTAYREALKVARYRLYARYGAFSPQVFLHGDFGWERREPHYHGRWHFSTRTQDRFYNYGVTGTWEVFDGGRRWFELREAQTVVAREQEALTASWVTVVAQVRQAHDNLRQQGKLMAIATENLELVQRTRDLVEEEYKAGNTSLTRLNEAQRDLIVAETRLVSARINLADAKLQLEAVTAADPGPP